MYEAKAVNCSLFEVPLLTTEHIGTPGRCRYLCSTRSLCVRNRLTARSEWIDSLTLFLDSASYSDQHRLLLDIHSNFNEVNYNLLYRRNSSTMLLGYTQVLSVPVSSLTGDLPLGRIPKHTLFHSADECRPFRTSSSRGRPWDRRLRNASLISLDSVLATYLWALFGARCSTKLSVVGSESR